MNFEPAVGVHVHFDDDVGIDDEVGAPGAMENAHGDAIQPIISCLLEQINDDVGIDGDDAAAAAVAE